MANFSFTELQKLEKKTVLHRFTALWAFVECGIGGILHGFKFPFTGLFVGGFAVLIICLIATLSYEKLTEIFHSLVIVLIVKLAVSPQAPFTAYIAVIFQATLGYWIFKFSKPSYLSISVFSIVCMLQSALQKLIVLTIFFGETFWNGIDKLVNAITSSTQLFQNTGSYIIISVYLLIYIIGSLFIAKYTNKIIIAKNIVYDNIFPLNNNFPALQTVSKNPFKKYYWIGGVIFLSCIYLYLYNSTNQIPLILKYIVVTIGVIWFWYKILSPFLVKSISNILKKNQSKYQAEVDVIFELLPTFKSILAAVYYQSSKYKGLKKLRYFLKNLIINCLLYSEK